MKRGARRAISLLRRVLVGAVVVLAAWCFIDFTEVWQTLKKIQVDWLLVLLVLATVDRFLMAAKWHHLLRHTGSPATFAGVLSAYYQAAFMQRFLPSSLGGDALRALLISRRFGRTSGVLASMVVEKLVAMLASVFIALTGVAMVMSESRDQATGLLLMTIPGLLVLMLVVLRLSLHQPLATWMINWIPGTRVRSGLHAVYAEYAEFRKVPRALIANFLFCLLEQSLQVILLLSCALALNVDAGPYTIVAAIGIAQCLRKFAILLEGWLLGEFTAVVIYTLLGIPEAQALAFSLLGHATGIVATVPGAVRLVQSTAGGGWSRAAPGAQREASRHETGRETG